MRIVIPVLLIGLIGLASPSSAEKLYKFVDENGRVTFTDKPVGAGSLAKVSQVRKERPMQRVSLQNRGSKAEPVLYAVNSYFGPVEAEFELKELRNMSVRRLTGRRPVIPAAGEIRAMTLLPQNARLGYSYNVATMCVLGDPKAKHRPDRPYLLPIPPSQEFHVSQAFHGEATHGGDAQNSYAVDIPMPVGTPIHAARSGVVMDVAGDFFEGGASEEMLEQANYVRVLHDDGTMAVYAHLALETVQYPMGKRVERGQVIALSGNTGFSTGPHLHFAIQKNFGMELRSVSFEFEAADGSAFTPEAGMTVSRSDRPARSGVWQLIK